MGRLARFIPLPGFSDTPELLGLLNDADTGILPRQAQNVRYSGLSNTDTRVTLSRSSIQSSARQPQPSEDSKATRWRAWPWLFSLLKIIHRRLNRHHFHGDGGDGDGHDRGRDRRDHDLHLYDYHHRQGYGNHHPDHPRGRPQRLSF